MSEHPGLLAPALRECVAALEALDATHGIVNPTAYWKALDAARSACTTARHKAQAALKLYDARTPASAWD